MKESTASTIGIGAGTIVAASRRLVFPRLQAVNAKRRPNARFIAISEGQVRGHSAFGITPCNSETVREVVRGDIVNLAHQCPRTKGGKLVTYENRKDGMGSLKFVNEVFLAEGIIQNPCKGKVLSRLIVDHGLSFSAWQVVNVLEDHDVVWAEHLSYDASNLFLVHDSAWNIHTLVAKWQKGFERWLFHFSEFASGRGPNKRTSLHFKKTIV